MEWMLALAGVVGLWMLLELKTSRSDGTLVKGLHPYRRIMQYIMTTRNESLVYFDVQANAAALLAYLKNNKEKNITLIHVLVGALAQTLEQNPKMNRFVSGRRLYQRKGMSITFTAKRKKLDAKSKLAMVQMPIEEGIPFSAIVNRMNEKINVERSDSRTYADKEYDLFNLLPRPLLVMAVKLLKTLDYYNILPGFFIRDDALYVSCVLTNLGSLKMAPAYHHLYEWGNCPLFLMVGQVEERVVARNGEITTEEVLPMRIAFDERIEDGLTAKQGIDQFVAILEAPQQNLE
ncbi:MAG: hypothetical protein CMH56_06310 [Myxococcales bacterium]|nr:hypothetical protein [Myxococcales bacterium]|tara:strand:- start:1095 stop:1967 length:873 start_codon:yes stop_codon:yes gene_type:complete